ncbi:MAG: outer membrane beta-barrel protein [Ignavibacteriae bacterium]|nr:outer membrane beta-barrel protein [Ignavibacteria bacterium]MBI3365633.1 outer membrane beta-barrel protein [Ignavibacteriota bacterium]
MKAFALFCMLVTITSVASSQPSSSTGWFVQVEGAGGVPTGKFNDLTNVGFAGRGSLLRAISDNFALTLSSGFFHFGGKDYYDYASGQSFSTAYNVIPITIGDRFFFTTSDVRVYQAINLGLYLINESASTNVSGYNVTISDNASKFGAEPVVGIQFRIDEKMTIDANASYPIIFNTFDGGSSLTWFGFGLGIEIEL